MPHRKEVAFRSAAKAAVAVALIDLREDSGLEGVDVEARSALEGEEADAMRKSQA